MAHKNNNNIRMAMLKR